MNWSQQAFYETLNDASRAERATTLFTLMVDRGASNYDEDVTQLAHALQAATLASESNAGFELITAALFHGLGHLLLGEDNGTTRVLAEDLDHEHIGASFLNNFFPLAVTDPIRLHVPAKHYLCSTETEYWEQLSEASKRSLEVQGGLFSETELAALRQEPFLRQALDLRRWDDQAKVTDLEVPAIEAYRSAVETSFLTD